MYGESALGVVYKAEILSSLFDRYDVHEACRIGGIGADFPINLDETLHDNCFGLTGVQRILQTIN